MSYTGRCQNKIGLFDNCSDIGNCKFKGKVNFNSDTQTYLLSEDETPVDYLNNGFHYLWTTLQGDFILRAEFKIFKSKENRQFNFGWMIKNNLDNVSPFVSAEINEAGVASFKHVREEMKFANNLILNEADFNVIQLERRGLNFIMSVAQFGDEFSSVQFNLNDIDNEVYVGVFIGTLNQTASEGLEFRNVRIVKPVDPNYVPYTDYIGSHLELMDVETGHRKIIYSSAHSIQAPNWTPDGKTLIYNSKGYLYKYSLENQEITQLNTGFANKNNNDHVLTFDGKLMGISHHSAENEGLSTIYYLPVTGDSNPVRVTKLGIGHSFLHGWTPDNKKMIFTAYRKEQWDIYSVEVSTGKETQLTNQKTLDDGSEYSPDGKHIFFNSVRTGTMKLWRMDADGQNQTQLTFDGYNDWFPHVSPDMKWIVFISFPKDMDPNTHPFYKHCLLRIMPYEGGVPKVIGYVYGGQGTINVPSWSPDSKTIAFVSNSKF